MTRLIGSLAEVSQGYDTLYCDLWGCLHNGHRPYPDAVAALVGFREAGGRVVLLTNAPRPSRFVVATLDRMGVPREAWDLVVSSGDAAQAALAAGDVGRKVWHLGPAKDMGFFDLPGGQTVELVSLEEAEGIVCTGPFNEYVETPEDYRARLTDARDRGLPLLCTNPDLIVDFGDRRIYCAGALAGLYDDLGGRSLYFGKPHAPIYDLAGAEVRALTGGEQGRILAIGDGVGTDIKGAAAQGIDALFVTGGLAAAEFGPDVEAPDPALVDRWLAAQGQSPAYAIGRLR